MKDINWDSLIDLDQPLPIYAKVITTYEWGDFFDYYKIYETEPSLGEVTCTRCNKYSFDSRVITESFNMETDDNQKFIQITKEEYEEEITKLFNKYYL